MVQAHRVMIVDGGELQKPGHGLGCRFGIVGFASLRSWYRCSAYPVLRGGFFHS